MKKWALSGFFLLHLFMLMYVAGCNTGGVSVTFSIPTPTFTYTVTPSPTRCPTIVLPDLPEKAPEPWTTLWIIAFNPETVRTLDLGSKQQLPFQEGLVKILQEWTREGDRIVVLQIGCRYFSNQCWRCNDLLPTPRPRKILVPPSPTLLPTFTPSPTVDSRGKSLFVLTAEARHAAQTATAAAPTEVWIDLVNECAQEQWKSHYLATHEAYQKTQEAISALIASQVQQQAEHCTKMKTEVPTPYTPLGTVLDALYQISFVLHSERGNFDQYVVLLFDELRDWRVDNITGEIEDLTFDIDLQDAEIFLFPPNCQEEYYPPECQPQIQTWKRILSERFHAKSVYAIPNSRILDRIQIYFTSGE